MIINSQIIIDEDQARCLATKMAHRYILYLGRLDGKFWHLSVLPFDECHFSDVHKKKEKQIALDFQRKTIEDYYQFLTSENFKASFDLRKEVLEGFLAYFDELTKNTENQEFIPNQFKDGSMSLNLVLKEMLSQAMSVKI